MATGDVIINIPAEYVEPITSMGQGFYTMRYGFLGLGGAIANSLQPYVNSSVQTLIEVSSQYIISASTVIKTTAIDIGNLVYDNLVYDNLVYDNLVYGNLIYGNFVYNISGNVIDTVYTLPQTIGLKTRLLRKKTKVDDIEAQNEWCVLNDAGELIILESDNVSIQIEN